MTDPTVGAEDTGRATVDASLRAADIAARDLLLDVRGTDAPAMLRAWGNVVTSAALVWDALPEGSNDATMTRLAGMTRGLNRSHAVSGWPRAGAPDDRLTRISRAFVRAREAGQRSSAGFDPDAGGWVRSEARIRVLHTLYITSHAVAVAVREHVREAGRRRNGVAQTVDLAVVGPAVLDRLAAFERIAGDGLGVRADVPLPAQALAMPGDRLRAALVQWDIQAHRTLATTPTPGALVMISRVQASLATTGYAVFRAAAATGHVDHDTFTYRLAPALDRSHRGWARMAGRWAELTSPTSPADQSLNGAAAHLRAAMLDVAFDGPSTASPHVVAARLDPNELSRDLHQALSAAVDVAYDARDIAANHPDLCGPAKVMSRRASDEAEIRGPTIQGVWVPLRDVHANRVVPMPAPARAGLVAAADEAVQGAAMAMSTAAALDRPTAATGAGRGGRENPRREVRSAAHQHEQRLGAPVPSSGPAASR